jgi:omega-hydroxypalmitate O-feruloyl transferase
MLTVQVTTFKCGGFVLGLAMNHCLADGQSAAEFICSWAETARGVALSTPPYLDRMVQRARPIPTIDFPHDEFTEIEDVSSLAGIFDNEPCVYRSFTFDAAKLNRLKQAASDEARGTKSSIFVALTAFVWVTRTRARGSGATPSSLPAASPLPVISSANHCPWLPVPSEMPSSSPTMRSSVPPLTTSS